MKKKKSLTKAKKYGKIIIAILLGYLLGYFRKPVFL
jgi:hypothetical protein